MVASPIKNRLCRMSTIAAVALATAGLLAGCGGSTPPGTLRFDRSPIPSSSKGLNWWVSAISTGLGKDRVGLEPQTSTGSVIIGNPKPGAYIATSFLSSCKDATCLEDKPPTNNCGGYVLIRSRKTVRVHVVFLADGKCRVRITGLPTRTVVQ